MNLYMALKMIHVLGAMVLFGTGVGIAFFMLMAHRTYDAALVAQTATMVVLADTIFTASAVLLQPATGVALARMAGFPVFSGWVGVSLVLYLGIGLCWLPVVFIQIRMRTLAFEAVRARQKLPGAYFKLFRVWFALGIPAFVAMMGLLWLMIAKPDL